MHETDLVVMQVVLQQQQRAAVAERALHPEDAGLARQHPAGPQHAQRGWHCRPERLHLQLGRQPPGVQLGKVAANILIPVPQCTNLDCATTPAVLTVPHALWQGNQPHAGTSRIVAKQLSVSVARMLVGIWLADWACHGAAVARTGRSSRS